MAKDGQLPRRLAKCHVPVCSACGYAKATKRPWRSKTVRDREAEVKPTRPGQVVSVDQLVSPTPGLIAQMTGFLTKQRYNYATVYVDQATSLGFVYLQRTATAAKTIQGKKAFERYALNRGVKVVYLHPLRGVGRHEEGPLTPRRAIAPRSGPPSKSASVDLAVHDEELLPAEESIAPTSAPTTRRGCRLLL